MDDQQRKKIGAEKPAADPQPPAQDGAVAGPPADRHGEELPPSGIELGPSILALGEATVAQVVTTFLANAADMQQEIEDAFGRRDAVAMEHAAHSLKGSSGALGARRMMAICLRIEELAEAGSFADAEEALRELDREHEVIRQRLREPRPAP